MVAAVGRGRGRTNEVRVIERVVGDHHIGVVSAADIGSPVALKRVAGDRQPVDTVNATAVPSEVVMRVAERHVGRVLERVVQDFDILTIGRGSTDAMDTPLPAVLEGAVLDGDVVRGERPLTVSGAEPETSMPE